MAKWKVTPEQRLPARFWSKVDRRGPDECWPWLGALDSYSYGNFHLAGKPAPLTHIKAHRFAWILTFGAIPSGSETETCVLHRCDNPPCCNPSHLFLGSRADNNLDKKRKGRSTYGERHPRARLNSELVRLIRQSSEMNVVLAIRFGVAPTTISAARRRITWPSIS